MKPPLEQQTSSFRRAKFGNVIPLWPSAKNCKDKRIMNICVYSYYFCPLTGGLQTFSKGLAEYLTRRAIDVTLVTQTSKHSANQDFRFSVIRAPNIRQLLSIISNSDVVHMNGFALKIVFLALLRRKPIIWTHHEYDSICPIGIGWDGSSSCGFGLFRCALCMRRRGMTKMISKRFACLLLRRIAARLVRYNVNPSFYIASRQNLPCSVVIPHGVEVSKFRPSGDGDSPEAFLFLGRLIGVKGIDVLIRAAKRCVSQGYPVKVSICGEGPDKKRLKMIAKALMVEQNICFKDYVYGDQLVNEINESLAIVVPSLWDEVFGFVALEAMSCGKVVIASDVGGLAELVRPVGLLFERGNADALADQMIEVWTKKELRKTLELKARRHAQSFHSWEIIGNQYLQLYYQCKANRGIKNDT